MPELMAASDILITKAGPGTISEAFIAGIPTILNGYIPGQETGNVTYVTQNRAGAFAESPHSIAQTVREWLAPNSPALSELIYNASRLARPEASLAIATDLHRLLDVGVYISPSHNYVMTELGEVATI
jgi:1,2-diacylglycerol 3-beta-galactosyltransferase